MENLGAMVRYEAWGVEERSEKEEQGYTGCGHPWRRALEVPVVGRTSSGLATSSSPPNGTPNDHRSDIVPRSGDSLRVIANGSIWR